MSPLPFPRQGWTAVLLLLTGIPGETGAQESPDELLKILPAIRTQQDGVVRLPVESAAVLHGSGKMLRLARREEGFLPIEGGRIIAWSGEIARPAWRFEIPQPGPYRAVLTGSAPPGRGGTFILHFRGPRDRRLTRRVDPAGGWDAFTPCVMGDTDLDAGTHVLELRPVSWNCPREIVRLGDVRLVPLAAQRQAEASIQRLLGKPAIAEDPAVKELSEKVRALQEKSRALNAAVRRRDFKDFADFGRFLEFDGQREELAKTQSEQEAAEARLREARQARLKAAAEAGMLKPEEAAAAEAFRKAEASVAEGQARAYPPPAPLPPAGPAPRSLFPTGRLDSLPPQ